VESWAQILRVTAQISKGKLEEYVLSIRIDVLRDGSKTPLAA
jgi:hypothetical protein